ncbi:unnamed protein product [Clonostachys byssicola]|uniref:C2H2-type domain-containing protein n=1 Tax=Clonostachys byssicola TaxID=160290 RepID=A0A9N9UTG2_9HYPO|nr:unnamed protein product [Clonostachys byssicola]
MGVIPLEETIAMRPRDIKKFYEPMVLFKALTMRMLATATHSDLEEDWDLNDPKQLFEAFVNKLCYVCDNKKGDGGATITSFVVLQLDDVDTKQYVFACNQQTNSQLQATEGFVKQLLELIGKNARRKVLLHLVLWNNRKRIRLFFRDLVRQASTCLTRCLNDVELEKRGSVQELLNDMIAVLPDDGQILADDKADYLSGCDRMMKALGKFEQQSPTIETITQMSRDIRARGHNASNDCWPEMLHAVKRILAYQFSIEFLKEAHAAFPELFEDFEISFLPSSTPLTKREICRVKSYQAEGIVNRMTSNAEYHEKFKQLVNDLQVFDLDQRIQDEYEKASFRPFVHSEAHLHGWLGNTPGGFSESRFFRGWRYIGSSKPTCKLCHYYFQEHGSGVGHRICHSNLYPCWRLPDVPVSAGTAGGQDRRAIYYRIIDRVRNDAFDIIGQKASPKYRKHDSNTFSARMTFVDDVSTIVSNVDDVSSLFGDLDINE